jgi:hypothetical protein
MEDGASDAPADDAAAVRARKTAAATAAAAAARAQIVASVKGPYGSLHSSEQVLLLEDHELWDTMAEHWCKPGAETISAIVDTWEGRDLAACVHRLGLPVIYAKRNYQMHMRASVVNAVRKYAQQHPELFTAADGDSAEESEDAERPSAPAAPVSPPAPRSAPLQSRAPEVSPAQSRRSPRAPASSRSAAAMAVAALQQLPAVSSGAGSGRRAASAAPHRQEPQRSERVSTMAPPLDVRLHGAGAGGSDASDDSDSNDEDADWSPATADPLAASLRRGGRLRGEDMEHQLAQAGVPRSFAAGFVANARFAAGGRSMYQLYKEVTASFSGESSRRECLALSRILDALLRGDVSAALEHTCRRLGGVHTAADTGNWAMCERLESEAEQRSFVPDAFMRSALRSVTQMQAVKKSAADGAAGKGARSKGAAASGRERRSSPKPNKRESHKDRDTPKDSGAGASHKKGGSTKA